MRFGALVGLFLRDLSRRRLVWIVVVVAAAMIAIAAASERTISDALLDGESVDIATRRAGSTLRGIAEQAKLPLFMATFFLAGAVAPESRRNGTTQYLLTLGVSRVKLALAQYWALALLITSIVVVVHVGFAIPGLRTGVLAPVDVAAAWAPLLVSLLALAAAVHALALTTGPFATYLLVALPGLSGGIVDGPLKRVPAWIPDAVVNAIDNVRHLDCIGIEALVAYPKASFVDGTSRVPVPTWAIAQAVLATTCWIALGWYRLARHDVGSRTALK